MLAYTLLVAPVGVLPYFMGFAGLTYAAVSTLLGIGFIYHAWQVCRMADTDRVMLPAKAMFKFSLLYLTALFATLLVENIAARLWGA